jgi:hypothetical protein
MTATGHLHLPRQAILYNVSLFHLDDFPFMARSPENAE